MSLVMHIFSIPWLLYSTWCTRWLRSVLFLHQNWRQSMCWMKNQFHTSAAVRYFQLPAELVTTFTRSPAYHKYFITILGSRKERTWVVEIKVNLLLPYPTCTAHFHLFPSSGEKGVSASPFYPHTNRSSSVYSTGWCVKFRNPATVNDRKLENKVQTLTEYLTIQWKYCKMAKSFLRRYHDIFSS